MRSGSDSGTYFVSLFSNPKWVSSFILKKERGRDRKGSGTLLITGESISTRRSNYGNKFWFPLLGRSSVSCSCAHESTFSKRNFPYGVFMLCQVPKPLVTISLEHNCGLKSSRDIVAAYLLLHLLLSQLP